MDTRRIRSDQGSIPIALLAIIALTSIIGALVATTIGGSRAARFDQQYTEVIQIADTAAQEGAQRLLRAVAVSDLNSTTPTTYSGSGTLDGTNYTWTARRKDTIAGNPNATVADRITWEVTGTATTTAAGSTDPVTREVVLEMRDKTRFFVAAFSDESFRLNGGNAGTSYDIGSGAVYTGNGIVASNGTIRLNGNADVNGVQLYNFDNLPNLSRCDGRNQAGQCGDLLAAGGPVPPSATFGQRLDIGPGATLDTQFIDDQLATCGTPLADFTASVDGTTIGTAGTTTVLCVNNLTIDRDVTINGDVEIFVDGTFSVANAKKLNCTSCNGVSSVPDSTKLKIYMDGGPVSIGNHTYVAAGIYAPESECGGNPSNAQGDIYGSIICREITNQGGWAFHFDDQLATEGAGEYQLSSWREQ